MSRNKVILYPLYVVCAISLAIMLLLAMDYRDAESRLQAQAQTQAKLRADDAVAEIESQFSRLKAIVDDVVSKLEQTPLQESELRSVLVEPQPESASRIVRSGSINKT